MRIIILLFIISLQLNGQIRIPESVKSVEVVNRMSVQLADTLKNAGLALGDRVFIRVFKETEELELWMRSGGKFKLFKIYPVCTYGSKGLGPKLQEGDGIAPEGFYAANPNSLNPNSSYHLSFDTHYPNSYDRAHNRTGSALMIHGSCVSIGCYAMTDEGIEEIYTIVEKAFRAGQGEIKIHLFPFRMTDENMERHKESEWYEFWQNLKEGYDLFENSGVPPSYKIKNLMYIFN